jgi:hypothetical protein
MLQRCSLVSPTMRDPQAQQLADHKRPGEEI